MYCQAVSALRILATEVPDEGSRPESGHLSFAKAAKVALRRTFPARIRAPVEWLQKSLQARLSLLALRASALLEKAALLVEEPLAPTAHIADAFPDERLREAHGGLPQAPQVLLTRLSLLDLGQSFSCCRILLLTSVQIA